MNILARLVGWKVCMFGGLKQRKEMDYFEIRKNKK